MFADRCGACGAAHVPARLPRGKRPVVRATRWAAVVALVGAGGWLAFARRPEPAWETLQRALDAMQVGDYETSFQLARSVTEESPGDARGWYLLATSLLKLGMSPGAYVPAAERAVLLAPEMFEARNLLALHALDVGRTDVALEHALSAARAPGADARAYRLLARVELAQPRPDLARARDALESARRAGRVDPESSVLLAEVVLRTWGVASGAESRLPPSLRRVLRDAVDDAGAASPPPAERAAFDGARARILLALGELAPSLDAADAALAALAPEASPQLRSGIEATHAMALHAQGRIAAATEEFVRAIRRTPDASLAGLVASYFEESNDLVAAEAILANAAQGSDPHGAVHAVLARVQLRGGRTAEADASIAKARVADANNAGYAAIEAGVRMSQGRRQDARASLAEAVRLAPNLLAARIDLALIEIDAPGAGGAREKALREATAAIESMRAAYGDDPAVLRALGRLKFELGESEDGIGLVRRASAAAPWDAETWRVLGEMLLRRSVSGASGDELDESARDAARAFGQAASLRPGRAEYRIREADAWFLAGDPEAGVAALDQCTHADRGREDVLRRRATACAQLGDCRGAVADLERLRAVAPDDPAVLVNLVDTLLRAGEVDAARRLVADASPSQTDEVRRTLAYVVDVRTGRRDEAVAALARAEPTVSAAELLLSEGRVDDAVRMLRAVLGARPGDPAASRLIVLALLDGDAPSPARVDEARAVAAALPVGAPGAVRELIEGRILLAAGDADGAATRFAAAAASDGADPYAAMLRGEALFRAGERAGSLRSMRRALGLPGAPASFRRIAASRVLAASIESADAARRLRLAEEAFRLAPDLPATAVHVGALLSARGEFGRAADALERTLREADLPSDARTSIVFTAALQRFLDSDPRRAGALLGSLPPDARAASPSRLLAGYVALLDGRAADADAAFAAALEADPSSAPAAAARIAASLALRDDDEARRRVEAGARTFGGGWFLLHAARLFLREGHREDAASYARRAVEAAPSDAATLAGAAAVLARSGRGDDAVARLLARAADPSTDRAAALDLKLLAGRLMARVPGRAREALALARSIADDASAPAAARREATLLEAEALLCANDVVAAAAAARPLLATLPDGPPTSPAERTFAKRLWHALGTALSSVDGRLAEATQLLGKAYELEPDDEVTANNLAWLLSRSADTAERGLQLARRATDADPANASYWDTRAACAAASGAADEAETSWRRAISLIDASPSPDLAMRAECALGVARILLATSRASDAVVFLDRVVRDAPGSPAALEAARLRGK